MESVGPGACFAPIAYAWAVSMAFVANSPKAHAGAGSKSITFKVEASMTFAGAVLIALAVDALMSRAEAISKSTCRGCSIDFYGGRLDGFGSG